RSDREALHPLVGDAAGRVPADLRAALGAEVADRELGGQGEGPGALSGEPVELVDVGTVFIGDVDVPQVVGDADPFRVEPGIPWVRGRLRGVEVVGASGEVVRVVDGIQGGYAAADASTARAVDEALAARKERRAD